MPVGSISPEGVFMILKHCLDFCIFKELQTLSLGGVSSGDMLDVALVVSTGSEYSEHF